MRLLRSRVESLGRRLRTTTEHRRRKRLLVYRLAVRIQRLARDIRSLRRTLALGGNGLGGRRGVDHNLNGLVDGRSRGRMPNGTRTIHRATPSHPYPSPGRQKGGGSGHGRRFRLRRGMVRIGPRRPLFDVSLTGFVKCHSSVHCICAPPGFRGLICQRGVCDLGKAIFYNSTPRTPFLGSGCSKSFMTNLYRLHCVCSVDIRQVVNFFHRDKFRLRGPATRRLLNETTRVLRGLCETLEVTILRSSCLYYSRDCRGILIRRGGDENGKMERKCV